MNQWHSLDLMPAAAVVLAVIAFVLLAGRALLRARMRRRRMAMQDQGLHFVFDACAPEGGDVTLEPFSLGRLRAERIDVGEVRRHR
jgi:hypothetical protein